MNEIIWCLITWVSLNQLNGSAENHFYLTSHPNMKEYLENIQPEKTPHGPQPREEHICKMLKESRIFKAVDPETPKFRLLGANWERLLDFSNPSLVIRENAPLQRIHKSIRKEIEKLGNDRQCNSQIPCFKSHTHKYYLVFNSDITPYFRDKRVNSGIIFHYDRLLLVRNIQTKKSAVLALVQIHTRGVSRISRKVVDEALGTTLETNYSWTNERGEHLRRIHHLIEKDTFCSMKKYHVLNYCSRVLNLFWDWTDEQYKGFPGMANPSQVNSVDVSNSSCIVGKLNLPTQPEKVKETVFLPCNVKHQDGSTTQFHLTPAEGLFMAKNTDGEDYMLHGHIFPVKVYVKADDSKHDVKAADSKNDVKAANSSSNEESSENDVDSEN